MLELRPTATATGHLPDIRAGERIDLPDGAAHVVSSSYPEGGVAGSWLWTSRRAIVECNEFAVVRDGSRTKSLPTSIATRCTVETGPFRVSGDPES